MLYRMPHLIPVGAGKAQRGPTKRQGIKSLTMSYPPSNNPELEPLPGLFSKLGKGLESVRMWFANIVFLLFLVFLVITLSRGCSSVVLPSDAALILNPQGIVVEAATDIDPLQSLLSGTGSMVETELGALVRAVDEAAQDPNIKSLVLRLDELMWISTAHAQTLGAAIQRFRAQGKSTASYAYAYGQPQYLLASFAEAVYLHPLGETLFTGVSKYTLYYKDLLDKLKVNVHIFRVGTYKSFVEPYLRNDMSDPDREASLAMISGLWTAYTETVAHNRQLPIESVDGYLQNVEALVVASGGDLARVALEAQLVDELLTEDQARVRLGDSVGFLDDGSINGVGYLEYLSAKGSSADTGGDQYVTVITAQGQIMMQDGMPGAMSADAMSHLIRQAKEDAQSAALVLRVDSPGGSAFASELIRQELELYQLSGRPVVTSMGNVAASGGYWIAATSDAIIAEPTTITGSIGIFGQIPTFEKTLAMAGVHSDGLSTGPLMGGGSPLHGISPTLAKVIQRNVEQGYEQFLNLVARGRDMPLETVKSVAEGRVWLGSKALELGLVDATGGLVEAIAKAKALAQEKSETRDLGVKHLKPALDPKQQLLRMLLGGSGIAQMLNEARQPNSAYDRLMFGLSKQAGTLEQWLNAFDDPSHRYVLCTACNSIQAP